MKKRKSLGPEDADGLRVFLLQKKREMEATVAGIEERSRAEIKVLEDRLISLSHDKKLQCDELAALREVNLGLQRELADALEDRRVGDTLAVQVSQLTDELVGANMKIDRDQEILQQALVQLEDAEAEARMLHYHLNTSRRDITTLSVFEDTEQRSRDIIEWLEDEVWEELLKGFYGSLDTLYDMQGVLDAQVERVAEQCREQEILARELAKAQGELHRLTDILRKQEDNFEVRTSALQMELQQTEVLAQQEASMRGRQSMVLRELEQSVEEGLKMKEKIRLLEEELRRCKDTTPWQNLKTALVETQATLDNMRTQFTTDIERLTKDVEARDEIIGILQSELDEKSRFLNHPPTLPWLQQELTTLHHELTTNTPTTQRSLSEHVIFLLELLKYWQGGGEASTPELI
eukprot:TRINITY_DN47347_c0_g1_i1.p1 TRINITY_DN47347_c0_g1~~TRINITY_DN47347_c0_g1_i1.p1  ORF type:complete len:406 (+),score=80.67 TRINITY_DN47347_c0_g1_i1:59-1276(+)